MPTKPIVMTFAIPRVQVLTENRHRHYQAQARIVRTLRAQAAYQWTAIRNRGRRPLTTAALSVEILWPDGRRPDVGALSPTIKALVDGAVKGPRERMQFDGILPDDDPDHLVEQRCTVSTERSPHRTVIVRLTWEAARHAR